VTLPELPQELADALPHALDQAQRNLAPSHPGEVMAALNTLAKRRGYELPDDIALELDVEIMAAWPRDLWRKAFRLVWERFRYRRLPEVADFYAYISADIEERQTEYHRLETLRLRLKTSRLKVQWDAEAREHWARLRAR
jgi:hypothetical protein